MNQTQEKYQEFKSLPFPEGIAGEEIHGIDLVLLDADTAGLIEKYIQYNFKLTRTDYDLLKRLSIELKTATKELDGKARTYFATLWKSDFSDYDDAIQYTSALSVKVIEGIITRNSKDFKKSDLPILIPEIAIKLTDEK